MGAEESSVQEPGSPLSPPLAGLSRELKRCAGHPPCSSLLIFTRKRKSSKLEAAFPPSSKRRFLLWNGRNVIFVINSQIFMEAPRIVLGLGETEMQKRQPLTSLSFWFREGGRPSTGNDAMNSLQKRSVLDCGGQKIRNVPRSQHLSLKEGVGQFPTLLADSTRYQMSKTNPHLSW